MRTMVSRGPLLASMLIMLSACSILPEKQIIHTWQPPTTPTVNARASEPFSLRISTPHASGPLDATTIAVMPSPGQVSTYKGARWSDLPALLIRQRLVDAFMAANLKAVTTDDDRFRSDYTLSGDLRAFQTEYRAGKPVVVVRYDARLQRSNSPSLAGARSFTITRNPASANIPDVIQAFGAADDALARQVVNWAISVTERHPSDSATKSADRTESRSQT